MMMSLASKLSTMKLGSLLNLSQIHLSSTLVMPLRFKAMECTKALNIEP
ncbi:hypothetical protein V6Z11_D04G075500 [Gossypium hirsutum]